MNLTHTILSRTACETIGRFQWLDDAGADCSHTTYVTTQTRYGSCFIPTVAVGGIGTEPEHRREGLVRRSFDELWRIAHEEAWAVSLLHPFSFSYYRKFGYERVSDHRILEFPMEALENFPRCPDFVSLGDRLSDALAVFNAFTARRNLSFLRHDDRHYRQSKDRRTYLRYRDGVPVAYVTLSPESHYEINRMIGDCLRVRELVFLDREALMDCLGFLRMFEGEIAPVRIEDCAMMPELEAVLRHYSPVRCQVVPDIAARIIRPDVVLAVHDYPDAPGRFVIRVEDALDLTAGTFAVEFADGKADVRRADAPADIVTNAASLAPLLYGYEHYTPALAAYLDGVTVENPASDFFRAFGKQCNGVFEHF